MSPRFLLTPSLLALAACERCRTAPPVPDSLADSPPGDTAQAELPVVFVSDGANARVLVIRMDSAEILYEVDFAQLHPELCAEGLDTTCVGFGIEPSVDPDSDEDRLLYVVHVSGSDGGAVFESSIVAMVALKDDGPAPLWQLDSLDFSQLQEREPPACGAEAPCSAPLDSWEAWRACSLSNVHSVSVVEEHQGEVLLWISDTASPPRAVAVRLDTAERCGVVEALLDSDEHPDWGGYDYLNDLDPVSWQGEEMLLGTFFGSAAEAPLGGPGLGRVTAWRQEQAGWDASWSSPDAPMSQLAFLNAPHNADLVVVDGQAYVVYAHSNGLGGHWEFEGWTQGDDHRGSIGVLRLDDDGPTYLFDGYSPDPPLRFVRDVDLLDDGTWLVTDSGCINDLLEPCEHSPGLWHLRMDLAVEPVPGLDGRWQADHAQQNLLPVEVLDEPWPSPLSCGLRTPYESDLRWASQLGATLRARLDAPVGACGG